MTNAADRSDLSLIIVNYNGNFWLKKVLETIHQVYLPQTKLKVEVLVVDNGSTDSPAAVLKEFPRVKTFYTGQNLGFAGGNNVALRACRSRYGMLINSDIEFLPEDQSNLDKLVKYLEKNPTVGMIGPKVVLTNGQLDHACHRGEPTPWAAVTYFTGLAKLFPRSRFFAQYDQTYKNLDEIHAVDAITGAAMLFPMAVVKQVGLLDERFFLYAEDLDWCRRFRAAGYQVCYNPTVTIIHHKNKSGFENKDVQVRRKTNKFFWNTMRQYYDKYYPHSHYFFRTCLRTFLFIKKGGT